MADFIDFKALRRPASPNTYLLAPDGFCENAEPDAAAPVFEDSPDALYARLTALAGARTDWTRLKSDPAARALAWIAVTPLLRFKDDIDARVVESPGGATVAIYSRSRVGYSDLGANRKRVERLLADLMT
ncbi:MAG: DUF1499 domain-containing protein [Pseudomonadota bacterium]